MANNDRTPHISQFKTQIPGWRKVGEKYQGVIGCSMTGSATDPSYYEFVDSLLYNTPEEAMRAAGDLHHKLAIQGDRESD